MNYGYWFFLWSFCVNLHDPCLFLPMCRTLHYAAAVLWLESHSTHAHIGPIGGCVARLSCGKRHTANASSYLYKCVCVWIHFFFYSFHSSSIYIYRCVFILNKWLLSPAHSFSGQSARRKILISSRLCENFTNVLQLIARWWVHFICCCCLLLLSVLPNGRPARFKSVDLFVFFIGNGIGSRNAVAKRARIFLVSWTHPRYIFTCHLCCRAMATEAIFVQSGGRQAENVENAIKWNEME